MIDVRVVTINTQGEVRRYCDRSRHIRLYDTEGVRLARHKQANDETEKAQDGAEDLDDENLNESKGTRDISLELIYVAMAETYSVGSAASANAAPLPLMPTATPQTRLHMPTVRPDQNSA